MWIDVRSAVFSSNDPQPAQIFTLSLHDALPIYVRGVRGAFEVQVCKEARGRVREERLNLFAVQARQVRPVAFDERPTAARPALCDDGHARRRERLHVAVYCSLRDFESSRKFARRQALVNLQQKHYREQPVSTHKASSPPRRKKKRRPANMTQGVRKLLVSYFRCGSQVKFQGVGEEVNLKTRR